MRMGRTSHRLRNPRNAPKPWMEPLLQAYVDDPDDREPHAVQIDDQTVGYVEPIHVKPPCLLCHGENIPGPIGERLDARYPDDRARGFSEGDFRGMFWVTIETTRTDG